MIDIDLILLAVFIGLTVFYCIKSEKLKRQLNRSELKYNFEHSHVIDLKNQLNELLTPKPGQEQPEEEGTFVRTRRVKRATPETYRIVFDLDVNGQRVHEHLTMVFCKDAFVPDDKGGERQTSYNLGAQGVINFIVNNINTANNPNYEEQDND